jgi:plastocyanin
MRRLVLAALLASGCSPDRGGFGQGPPPSPPATPSPIPPATPVREVVVRAVPGLSFEPDLVRAAAGAVLELTLANGDRQPHTLVIEELNVLMLAGPGQEVTTVVRTRPEARGSFAFYCRIPGHGGMEGRIRVSPPG